MGFPSSKKRQLASISLYADVRKLLLPKYDIIYLWSFCFPCSQHIQFNHRPLGKSGLSIHLEQPFLRTVAALPGGGGVSGTDNARLYWVCLYAFSRYEGTPPVFILSEREDRSAIHHHHHHHLTNRPTNGVLSGQLPPPFVLTCTLF